MESGARLLVAARPASDVVAIDLRVRGAGSAAESAANSGAAHFVEHLVFKGGGAPDAPPGALDAAFESLGGEVGAQTSRDFVTYSITVPEKNWKAALRLLGSMLLSPAFRPADVEAERAVIRREMAVARGDARRLGIGALAGAAFPVGDPYRLPLMGTEQSIGKLTDADLRAFHAAHYRPGRFTLAVAGPVSLEAVREAAAEAFGGASRTETAAATGNGASAAAEAGEVPLVSAGAEARPVRAVVLPPADARTAATLNTVFFAFRVPAPRDPAEAALAEVTASLLARGGDEGCVAKRLTASGLAVAVRAEYLALRRGGLLLLSATGRGTADELESALVAELVRLREDGVPPGEVEAAKYARLGQAMADGEVADALAARLAYYDALDAAPDWYEGYAGRVSALTDADLARSVRDWLAPARRVVAVTGPDAAATAPSVAGARP